MRVEIFLGTLNDVWKKRLEIICLAVMSGFCLFALAAFSLFVYQSWDFNDVSQGQIIVPLWIPQICTALGCLIFFLAVVDELIRVIEGGKPRYQQMAEQRLSAGDFGETL